MSPRTVSVLSACVLLLSPAAGLAQEVGAPPVPQVEVAGGYSFMYDTDMEEEFPKGWFFSGAANVTNWFGVAGELSGAHKTFTESPGYKAKLGLYTLMAGPRFFVQTGRIVPFAQFLVGAAHARTKVAFPFEVGGMSEYKDNDTEFAIQPGGGLTVLLTRHVAVRGAVDYRRIFIEGGDEAISEVRGGIGFVFGWGSR
jgi:opacity protein-like surface antigen